MELDLHSDLIYENHLDTDRFARMLDDPSQCYKFYWLGAIISLTAATDNDISFDQIINEMICDAWYTVTQYHLHLGPTIKGKSENFLEHAIKTLEEKADLYHHRQQELIFWRPLRKMRHRSRMIK